MVDKIVMALLGLFFGGISGAMVVPVVWFISRSAGLIALLLSLGFRPYPIMILGGMFIGAIAGATVMALAMKAFGESNKLAIVSGAIGGVIAGAGSSIMFFPIIAIF